MERSLDTAQRQSGHRQTSGQSSGALCFLVDGDFGFRGEFAKSLRGFGVHAVEFASSARIAETIDDLQPDLIFLNVNLSDPYDCVRGLLSLKECNFTGRVQIIGRGEVSALNGFRKLGAEVSLTMLPVMQKPLSLLAVRGIIKEQNLAGRLVTADTGQLLGKAIANNWLEFWYQPKIDLKNRRVVGAEAFVRLNHPQHGTLFPEAFLGGASPEELSELSKRAVLHALDVSARFGKLGFRLAIATNMSAETFLELPLVDLVAKNRPSDPQWPGLIVEVTETQLLNRTVVIREKLSELQKIGVRFSIDKFGRGNTSFSLLRYLPFAEIKIDQSFAQGCSSNSGNASVCKSSIQIAHNFSGKAVAVGLEEFDDLRCLTELGCDVGQGYLFGRPMPEHLLQAMLRAGLDKSETFCDPIAS
jgi:EAL domain-containing protein (putative c-di-GMP-specific phosphodiesterase class I)